MYAPRAYHMGWLVGETPINYMYVVKKNNIYYFIVVGVLLTMFNPDYVTPLERKRRLKAAQKETKVAKTISIPISSWALLDEIKTKLGKKNANETLLYCIEQIGVELELET